MPIQIEWFNEEKTILLETFTGEWTVEDYRQLIDDAAVLLGTVHHNVHIIADATDAGLRLPNNLLGGGMTYAIRHIPPNQGITVFIGVNGITQTLIGIARKISPKVSQTTFTATTLEEAQRIIANHIAKTV
jgi:hypothetical protein